jgi:hypothetical protein
MNDSIALIFLRKSLSKHLFTHDYNDYDDDLLFKWRMFNMTSK